MLIEQIIEFEWRGLGPLDRTCTLTTGYFQVHALSIAYRTLAKKFFCPTS